jgi:kanamycin kinase
VLDAGGVPDGTWMLTAAIAGENAVSERWRASPEKAVAAIGRGLRSLHDRLPVLGCPFDWSAAARVASAFERAGSGKIQPNAWHPSHRHLALQDALAIVREIPPVDQLVVCHGDACAPNTIVDDGGQWTGHVDLGALGLADRWADLAIATWSSEWNYGAGWQELLLSAYGIDPDPVRTSYYRLLWDLGQ